MWPRINGLRTLDLGTVGELRAWLNSLVLSGAKTATAGVLERDYRAEGEEPEVAGERLVLIDSDEAGIAEVEVTSVDIVPFASVTWEFAQAEGEGYTSLAHWRDVHLEYWKSVGQAVEDTTDIVCVHFRLVGTMSQN